MELIRTFLAVPPDDALQARLAALMPRAGAAEAATARGTDALRWAEPSGLHLTLVFLGATRVAQIEALCAQVSSLARRLSAFAYALAGPVLFPDARRPRVLALEPVDGSGFHAWQRPLAVLCEEAGFAREARAYRPHLSLARVKRAPPVAMAALREPLPGIASQIVLYESRGGRYTPLFRAACEGGGRAA